MLRSDLAVVLHLSGFDAAARAVEEAAHIHATEQGYAPDQQVPMTEFQKAAWIEYRRSKGNRFMHVEGPEAGQFFTAATHVTNKRFGPAQRI
jgi:hypothetical protein